MKFYSTPSFTRYFGKLDPQQKANVKEAINKLINAYTFEPLPAGLGLKKLRQNLWEIRVSLGGRILFSILGDKVSFILVGSHDDIRKYLKNL